MKEAISTSEEKIHEIEAVSDASITSLDEMDVVDLVMEDFWRCMIVKVIPNEFVPFYLCFIAYFLLEC